jgi:predicted dehydrogenase
MNCQARSSRPLNVVLMGGGRWARVYVTVLLELIPVSSRVIVVSRRNSQAMADWVDAYGAGGRVRVLSEPPTWPKDETGAVLVVNAAADHERSVCWALSQGAAVLVEKPFTCSADASSRLIDEAGRRDVYLAAAHVFLFADYLHRFGNTVRALGETTAIDVVWADAAVEARHGEVKSFDPGLRVFEDCLPHVMSIWEALIPGASPILTGLELSAGGARLDLALSDSTRQYTVCLMRNAATRQRLVTAKVAQSTVTLDFSCEPGTITNGQETLPASPDWASKPKPLSLMLQAFLVAVAGGDRDARLSAELGLRASRLAEEIQPLYEAAQAEWLSKRMVDAGENDENMRYALMEIAMSRNPQGASGRGVSEVVGAIRGPEWRST